MKILFVYLGTLKSSGSGVIRNRTFIQGAIKNGHSVDVLMLDDYMSPNYDENVILDDGINIKLISMGRTYEAVAERRKIKKNIQSGVSKNNSNVFMQNVKTKANHILRRLKYITSFDMRSLNKNIVVTENDYDLMVSSSDPIYSHIYSYHLRNKNKIKCPWIQYWGDPLMDDINFIPNGFEKAIVKQREKNILKKATSVVYTSPLTLNIQKKLFPTYKNKMHFANQACLNETDDYDFKDVGGIYNIGYFGDYHSRTRNLIPLIQAVAKDNRIHLIIAGNGDLELDSTAILNLQVCGRCKSKELNGLEEKTDIIVGICNKSGGQIPAKFYYESGCKKPIIAVIDGEYKDELLKYFDSFNRYIICDNNPVDISRAINEAIFDIQQKKKYELPESMKAASVANRIINSVLGGEDR